MYVCITHIIHKYFSDTSIYNLEIKWGLIKGSYNYIVTIAITISKTQKKLIQTHSSSFSEV